MNQVIVRFVGICTHVSQTTVPGLPEKQRAVLVNARDGRLVRELPIRNHTPGLQIGDGEQFELDGSTVRLVTENSFLLPLILTDHFHALPNLTQLVGELTTLGEPSTEMVLDRNPEHSAAYFDIGFGLLSACKDNNGAAVATLVVESPHPISLEIAKWGNALADVPPLPLPSGTVVWVGNIDPPGAVNEHPSRDFLLHYLTAARMPHTPQVPQTIDLPRCDFEQPFQTVGAGCSNSNYP